MADELRHDHLTSLRVRRDAFHLYQGLDRFINDTPRDAYSILMALAVMFSDISDVIGVDPIGAFEQIYDAHDSDQLMLADDPAQGRFVHPEHIA